MTAAFATLRHQSCRNSASAITPYKQDCLVDVAHAIKDKEEDEPSSE